MWSLRWHRKSCGAHSIGKSQGPTFQPALSQDWRHPEMGSWTSTTEVGQQEEGSRGSHSEAAKCVTMAKFTLAPVNLCFLDGKCL